MNIRGIVFGTLLIFVCGLRGYGAIDNQQLALYYKQALQANIDYFFGHASEVSQNIFARYKSEGSIRPQDNENDILRDIVFIRATFYEFVRDGKLSLDALKLRQIAEGQSLPAPERAQAFLLLYQIKGDSRDFANCIILSPVTIQLWTKLKDPNFAQLVGNMFEGSDAEQIRNVMQRTDTASAPYSKALARYYHKWLAAAYFQELGPERCQYMWDHAEILRFANMPVPVRDFVNELRTPAARRDLFKYLLKQGRDKELDQIRTSYPDEAGDIREVVSNYRLSLKRRLDGTLKLMEEATTQPALTQPSLPTPTK
ncbi:MAG TPA: hypothetical protein VM008_22185 [Phycisphaerae bacterium]|nr:hypothetical protein [Phycisphaerae bacterium]